ncbi:5-oxoprolinase subunit PxpA [Subsaximicrobium wynnwilliamsii]|uniref:5-oxoprolinase subunit PxpA n=1 Tax=Subsaximicrobium wynnwilliamsii TaxID=291179 RepID=A0A5C6ZJ78_9FLAO|nr:5-oxoprolinase subunit PxpA [Subsaximicrobium wynnwilliamsii]TXD84188.1 5-oxoprolinase subunit PxpA [Subsaximicrobium wynnwilliamsii]TXD89809.1 5-oxoprolinase subunit PxpA [Subsaximicrobium wynnwilliamsii]TXE03900.1 5-oxoprolinase subunit PxpA [Subsaximicrobium wynnwilliamsii]
MNSSIDINCDLGEGMGNEASIMPLISSCNIACGAHAGDLATMETVVDLAQRHQVKIGAHPSFPDKANFGRKVMQIPAEELRKSLTFQIESLMTILKQKNGNLHHVKPHGALYNLAAKDEATAKVVVEVVKGFGGNFILYAPYQSVIAKVAKAQGVPVMFEAFADRHYNADLSLVARTHEQALIHNPDEMFAQVYRMVSEGKVRTRDGVEVSMKADTFCVHGDGKNVVENLEHLRTKLMAHHITMS